jgi:type IV secretion system protein VirB3
MEAGKLKTDPLFLGMTRPPMFMGVTYMWGMVEIAFCCIYFINTSSFYVFFLFAFLHVVGLIISSKDGRLVEVWFIGMKTNFRCTNKAIHGNISSYDVF